MNTLHYYYQKFYTSEKMYHKCSIEELNLFLFLCGLNDNNIGWYQNGSNLNYIQLVDKKNDFSKIQKVWKEVK